MRLKGNLKVLAGQSQKANQMIGEQFSNLEDKLITLQENQLEFEKYLKDIQKMVKKLLK